jgi:hypothetical protein
MPITSCVGQQLLLFLTTAAYLKLVNEFIFVLRTQTNLSRSASCNMAPNAIYVLLQQEFICDIRSTLISCFVLHNSGSSDNAMKYV